MKPNDCAWKPDWPLVKQHLEAWWQHRGPVVGQWTPPSRPEPLRPGWALPDGPEGQARLEDPEARARMEMSRLSHMEFPGDTLPCTALDFGPNSLCIYLGSEPHWSNGTVWYDAPWEAVDEPEKLPALRFDPDGRWWKITETLYRSYNAMAQGKVLTPICPIGNGLDTLASLRGSQALSLDLLDRPEWVQERLLEIQAAWFDVYERLYQLSRQPDGGSSWDAFRLWSPGRAALLQCDFSAMISPPMFREFAVPGLREICRKMDHTMFHVDGRECLVHLDTLLEIEELDAIEWSPGAGRPDGASPVHFDMYRRILNAGKSLQITDVNAEDVTPLLDELGPEGVYIIYRDLNDPAAGEELQKRVAPYRTGLTQ